MTKKIDLVGMFSDGDVYNEGNPYPILFKFIDSIIDDPNYEINQIYLLYGVNKAPGEKEDIFNESFNKILDQLKRQHPSYTNKIDKLRDRYKIEYPEWKEIKVKNYFENFSNFLSKSRSDVVYFNLQSGNVQSKEALMILYQSSNKENLYFNTSSRNNSSTAHNTDFDTAEFYRDMDDLSNEEQKLDDIVKRVNIKETNDMALIFHKNIILNLLENKQYFKAYYHYIKHRTLFEANSAASILRNCFSYEIENLFISDSKSKKDIANYYLFRLIYLKAREQENTLDTKIAYNVCNKLLWVLSNLENREIISDSGDRFTSKFLYLEFNPKEQINIDIKNQKIRYIDQDIIERFTRKYNSLRHPRDNNFKQANFSVVDFSTLLSQLINKFEGVDEQEKKQSYLSYVHHDYKGSTFAECFEKTIERCIKNINTQLKGNIHFDLNTNKICFVSMFGSTDPANYKNDIFTPGSTLSFFKSISEHANIPSEKSELIKLKNKKITIPYYCILSNESIEHLFGKLEYKLEELKRIYNYDDIFFLPFERMNDGTLCNIKEVIKEGKHYTIEEMKLGTSLGVEAGGYSYKVCSEFIIDAIQALLEKYDVIYLIESSGIPNCKMALTYMSLCYPERIRVIEVIDPDPTNFKWGNNNSKNNKIKSVNTEYKKIYPQKSELLLDLIENNDVEKTIGCLYLIQSASKDDFINNKIKLTASMEKTMDELEAENSDNNNNYISKILVKIYYLLKFHIDSNALLEFDRCLETILGKKLYAKKIGTENKLSQIDNSTSVYNIYKKYQEKTNENHSSFIVYNKVYSFIRMINYIIDNNNIENKNEYFRYALRINEIWECVSQIKHPRNEEESKKIIKKLNFTTEDIDILLKFDISKGTKMIEKYNELKEKYESIRENLNIKYVD